jgi:hypothetical protein
MTAVVTTATTRLWLDDEGILHVETLPLSDETLASAQDNLAALLRLGGGVRRPLLVDMRGGVPCPATPASTTRGPRPRGWSAPSRCWSTTR